jgi:hypothetical protein
VRVWLFHLHKKYSCHGVGKILTFHGKS